MMILQFCNALGNMSVATKIIYGKIPMHYDIVKEVVEDIEVVFKP